MAKANSIIATESTDKTITFRVKDAGELVLNLSNISTEVATRAMLHGLIQRVSDGAALSRNPDNGQPASPEDKLEAMRRIVDYYNSGATEWALRKPEGGGGATGGITLKAVALVQGVDIATMRQRIEDLAITRNTTSRKLLAQLATQEAVAKKIAELRGAPAVDADSILDELA